MIDAKELHKEAAGMRQKMQNKLNDADKATLKAEYYSRLGDFHRASLQGEIANNDYRDALFFEREAVELDRKAVEFDDKVHQIEIQEDKCAKDDWTMINKLEMIKDKLRGYY